MKKVKSNNPCYTEGDARSILRKQSRDIWVSAKPQYDKEMDCHDLTSKSRNDSVAKAIESHNDKSTKHYKNFAVFFAGSLGVAFVISALLGILLYLYDPFMLFHKPYFRPTTYHSDLRIAARGIIDYADFNSVILGSSMIENTSAKEAGRKLGGKWVNLSMGGAHPNERAVVLEYLLKTKPPTRILYSFDTHSMILDTPRPMSIKPELYSDDFKPKWKFYLDKQFIKCAIKWSKKSECVGKNKELQNIPSDFYRRCVGEAGFLDWCQYDKVKEFLLKADEIYETQEFKGSIAKSQNLINKYILDFVRAYPSVEFHFAISAYPTFYYRVRIDDGYTPNPKEHFDKWRKILVWLVNEAQNLPNMKIYGFDDLPITNDTSNYIDQGHYKIGKVLNSIALDSMRDSTHILTPNNVEAYLNAFENKVRNYDIKPYLRELNKWEAER